MDLGELVSAYQEWLYLPDLGPLYVVLGATAANRLAGDPVWVFLVGPPSAGKTELLSPLKDALSEARFVDNFTQASLLTMTAGGEIGGLLMGLPQFTAQRRSVRALSLTGGKKEQVPAELGERLDLAEGDYFGLLVMKDFSVLLTSGGKEATEERFSVMRALYDGYFDRRVGHQGGKTPLGWKGKVGLLAAVTDEIDQYEDKMAALGHRYVYLRYPSFGPAELARFQDQARTNIGRQPTMRRQLSAVTQQFFEELEPTLPAEPAQVPSPDRHDALARLVAWARSHVGHDAGGRVTYVNDPEYPMRLGAELAQLYAGLHAIGLPAERSEQLVQRVGLDSVPPGRRKVLAYLVSSGAKATTEDVAARAQQPPQLAEVALGDLEAHRLVQRGADLCWAATDLAVDEWTAAGLKREEVPGDGADNGPTS